MTVPEYSLGLFFDPSQQPKGSHDELLLVRTVKGVLKSDHLEADYCLEDTATGETFVPLVPIGTFSDADLYNYMVKTLRNQGAESLIPQIKHIKFDRAWRDVIDMRSQ